VALVVALGTLSVQVQEQQGKVTTVEQHQAERNLVVVVVVQVLLELQTVPAA
jgi:hypothetical protein